MALADCYPLIIKIGKGEVNPKNTILPKYFPENSWNRAWCLYDKAICDNLSDIDLINFFKGLVISETELDWHCGSTSPAGKVYENHIRYRGLDDNDEIAEWALNLCHNNYVVPFGTNKHIREVNERIWKEQLESKIRKEKRKQKSAIKNFEQKEKSIKLREFYNKIENLPVEEQIEKFISDKNNNILFYCPIIDKILERNDYDVTILYSLLIIIESLPPTKFNKSLIKRIQNKIGSS